MSIDKSQLISRISHLSVKEKSHVLNILRTNQSQFTKNANGYFFNLNEVSDVTLKQLEDCLILIEENREKIKALNHHRDKMIEQHKSMIEDKITKRYQDKRKEFISTITLQGLSTSITLDVSKKLTKRLPNSYGTNDPDEMIKIHQKRLNTFVKDSVHWRIFKTIKARTRKVNHNEKADLDFVTENDLDIDMENENELDIDANVSDNFEDLDVPELGEELDEASDIESENSIDNEPVSTEHDETYTFDELHKIKIEEDLFIKKINYYKQILKLKGFLFEENEKCFLTKESYIL
jgi:hypothetical protein